MWSTIDGEHELLTEAWATPGSCSIENLHRKLDAFRLWVTTVLAVDSARSHG
jgi:hypothetical protein